MIIAKFQAENFKTIRAIEISPDPNDPIVQISGANGAGKSAILDAIEAAIAGGKAKKTSRPIRDGEERAAVIVEFGDIEATRTWERKTPGSKEIVTKITVRQRSERTDDDGNAIYSHLSRPQEVLDRFYSVLALDPAKFLAKSPKDQQAELVGLVDLGFDPVQLDAERAEHYSTRTDVGRVVKQLEGQLAGFQQPAADLPAAEVSSAELMDELETLRDCARQHEETTEELAHLQATADDLEERLNKTRDRAEEIRGRLSEMAPVPAEEIDAARSKINNADAINAAVRAEQQRQNTARTLEETKAKRDGLTAKIEALEKKRADGLAAAKFPVDGLGFDEDGVTYKGLPLSDASTAEQWETAMGVAAAANPELRVFRINEGSLIDTAHMATIRAIATRHEAQVWVEVVDESGDVGFVIEEGRVVADNGKSKA